MTLKEYEGKVDLLSRKEIDKVAYCAYYFIRTENIDNFLIEDVVKWFGELRYSKLNISRLRIKLRDSKIFVRGPKKGSYFLHPKVLVKLDDELKKEFDGKKKVIKLRKGTGVFVDQERITDLKNIRSDEFDLSKLIRLSEEINISFQFDNIFSIAMLTRTILDHIPPIFSCKNFDEVANNYGGAKSFKRSMRHLAESCRDIADQHLHTQIRKKEALPTITQVDFSNDLDVLLAEIIRLLKSSSKVSVIVG